MNHITGVSKWIAQIRLYLQNTDCKPRIFRVSFWREVRNPPAARKMTTENSTPRTAGCCGTTLTEPRTQAGTAALLRVLPPDPCPASGPAPPTAAPRGTPEASGAFLNAFINSFFNACCCGKSGTVCVRAWRPQVLSEQAGLRGRLLLSARQSKINQIKPITKT